MSFVATASDLLDGPLTPTCTPASGSTFAIGTTTVTCSATNSHGATVSDSFTITVRDTTAPTRTQPPNITTPATSPAGATVIYPLPTASDLVDGPRSVICVPASGTTFPISMTTVTCTATDTRGNTQTKTSTMAGSYSYTVKVVGAHHTAAGTNVSSCTITISPAAPSIAVVTKTNGTDNDTAPGSTVETGATVTWTYLVTNTGNVPLTNVAVVDSKGVIVTCPATTLAIGATFTCSASGLAVAGQDENIGTVRGTPPNGLQVAASNRDHYFGVS